MSAAIVLGVLQGVVEWLPVSSEGAVAATYSFLFGRPLDESIRYALWLHLGTVPSVLVVFRGEVAGIAREVKTLPRHPSPLLRYLVVSTAVSAVVGVPILMGLQEITNLAGVTAMGSVGGFMLVTGALQLRRPGEGTRRRSEISTSDAVLAGVVQGLAVIPGLSRSGTTVALLLARRVDRREALVLSFLMSVPASLGVALYAGLDSGLFLDGDAVISASVAFLVGMLTIRMVLALARRVNFGGFVLVVGGAMMAGAVWQAWV